MRKPTLQENIFEKVSDILGGGVDLKHEGSGKMIVGKITLNLLAEILLIVVTVTIVLLWMAQSQNKQATEATRTMVIGGVEAAAERIRSHANDYAWWQEEYDAFVKGDTEWLEVNVGASVYDTQVMDVVGLISREGDMRYSWILEKYGFAVDDIFSESTIGGILALGKDMPVESLAARSAFITAKDGSVILIGVSRITPIAELETSDPADRPYFVGGYVITEEFLKEIGKSFLIDDLRLSQDPIVMSSEEYADFPLITDIQGNIIGRLLWTPPTPGYDVLRSVVLPIGVVLALFCVAALATVFRARHLAGALAESNEDLEASQKEIAQQLRVVAGEKEKIESIVSSIGEGLIAVDPNGTVFLCNSVGALLLGKRREDIIGAPLEEIFDLKRNKSPELSSVFGVLEARKTVEIPEVAFVRSDGNTMTLSLTATPIESGNSFIGGIIVFNDVTEQKMVENAKRQFITTAAHQLRTPLSGIKWAMSVLIDTKSKSSPAERKSLLAKSYEGVTRVISLVNDLLNVDKIESGKIEFSPESTDIVELVRGPLTDLKGQMESKKLVVDFKESPNIPKVLVDPSNMRVVFQNLLENALHYTPAKGAVNVSVESDGKDIRVSVADTGIGIPRGEQKSIFLRFFRASNAVAVQPNGSGLGLYICKQIVEQHKGKIWFESEQNKGSTFHVVLPAETVPTQKQKSRAPKKVSTKKNSEYLYK